MTANSKRKFLFFTIYFMLTITSCTCFRLRQVDEDDAPTNQQEEVDIWSNNNLTSWIDTDDVELPTNEDNPWILVDDPADTLLQDENNNEWNDENFPRRKRQEQEEQFEGSGEELPSINSNTTEEPTNVKETPTTSEESPAVAVSSNAPPTETSAPPTNHNFRSAFGDSATPSEKNNDDQQQTVAPFLGVSAGCSGDCGFLNSNENEKKNEVNSANAEDDKNKERAALGTESTDKVEEKKSEAAVTTDTTTKSGGGKVTLLIIAGIIIVGAAAFTYHYFKKKMTSSNDDDTNLKDRELVEITVNKRIDPQQDQKPDKNSNSEQQKPLLENNRQNTNSVEITEVKEEDEEGDEKEEEERKQLKNGTEKS